MAHPKNTVPVVATDLVWATGPETGQPTRVAVPAGEQAQGMIGGERYPAAKFNYLLGVQGDHLAHMSEIGLRNWSRFELPSGYWLNNDVMQGIFCYARGAEQVPFVQIFGSDAAETSMVTAGSRTGRTWTNGTYTPGLVGNFREMAANADGSLLVGVGLSAGNKAQLSINGSLFTNYATHTAEDYRSVCFHAGAFYAVLQSGAGVGKSTDGSTWAATGTAPTGSARLYARSGKSNGTPCVLVAHASQSWISTDGGANWTASAVSAFSGIADLRYSDGLGVWMAVSTLGAVYTSADGLVWTSVRAAHIGAGVNQGIQKLATDGGGAWVVSGNDNDGAAPGPFVGYSVDGGVTWRYENLDDSSSKCFVAFNPIDKRFYAVCHQVTGIRQPLIFRTLSVGQLGGIVI